MIIRWAGQASFYGDDTGIINWSAGIVLLPQVFAEGIEIVFRTLAICLTKEFELEC